MSAPSSSSVASLRARCVELGLVVPVDQDAAFYEGLLRESSDPHACAPEVARFLHAGPDATMTPEDEKTIASEDAATEASGVTPLLPRVFLLRHGQSLFNAMYAAHAALPAPGQTQLNFGRAAGAAPLEEGALIGGVPLVRSRPVGSDARLIDAPLTSLGRQQAREAHERVRGTRADLVLTTPLTRAIQTALLAFRPDTNRVDWEVASKPSLDQPIPTPPAAGETSSSPLTPQQHHPPIRVIPHHVENMYASCDIGVPLSVLRSRFRTEPDLDFDHVQATQPDLWWAGASRGENVAHIVRPSTGFAAASSFLASAVSSSSSGASSSAAAPIPVVLKSTSDLLRIGIAREQSYEIEARTRRLIHYLLQLAHEHATTSNAHRAMNIVLVGHCGFFARLSGHTLENCELVELDWSVVMSRVALNGVLSLPSGFARSDLGDIRKQPTIVAHWRDQLTAHATRNNDANNHNTYGKRR